MKPTLDKAIGNNKSIALSVVEHEHTATVTLIQQIMSTSNF